MNTLSGISNRRFWSMYVLGGIRYFSINQETENDFPCFNHHILFYGNRDNLDIKMNTQIKYRLAKISRDLHFEIKHLGFFGESDLRNLIDVNVKIYQNSIPVKKLGFTFNDEIIKLLDQKPIAFGQKKTQKKLIPIE
jgi:hypothetical protein